MIKDHNQILNEAYDSVVDDIKNEIAQHEEAINQIELKRLKLKIRNDIKFFTHGEHEQDRDELDRLTNESAEVSRRAGAAIRQLRSELQALENNKRVYKGP